MNNKNTDAEKMKNEVNTVSTETEIHISSDTVVSPEKKISVPHGYFSYPEKFSTFSRIPAT